MRLNKTKINLTNSIGNLYQINYRNVIFLGELVKWDKQELLKSVEEYIRLSK